jgi:hypothetical protein
VGESLPLNKRKGKKMKVSKLIEQLKNYNENEEILVAYWDKSFADDYAQLAGDRNEITSEQWATIVKQMEAGGDYDLDQIGDTIHATVERVVPIGSEGAIR